MKKIFLLVVFILLAQTANASDKYVIDSDHTNITWFCSHFGFSDSSGTFKDTDGVIFFDENNPNQSFVKVTIKTGSVVTAIPKFTDHLKGKDFFNFQTYPEAKFESTSVKKIGKKTAIIEGKFTLLGVTKPIKLKAVFNKKGVNPFNQKRTIGFSAETTIKRSDYGMNYGLPGVGDEVKIFIELEGIHEEDVLLSTN